MTITVHTKSELECVQCDWTLRKLDSVGLLYEEKPGIDTAEQLPLLREIKAKWGLASAPIVVVRDDEGTVVDKWAGFRPDHIDALAAKMQPLAA